MTPLNKLDHLLHSWDEAARALGHQDSPPSSQTLAQKLYLVSRNARLQFELKPQRSLISRLIRFFVGEPKEESFRLQVSKIKDLYASIQEPSDEVRAKLIGLEERINSLGRYVFSRRTEKTLFCGPTLSDYQMRIYSQTEKHIEPGVLKRGLTNYTGNLCWLNASLKYLAGTPSYDKLLTRVHEKDPSLEAFRKTIFRVIEALRKNWDQHVVDALHLELIRCLGTTVFRKFLSGQEDADEFIVELNNHFSPPKEEDNEQLELDNDLLLPNKEEIHLIKLFTSFKDGVYKDGMPERLKTNNLQISPNGDELVDIEQCYMRPEIAEGVNCYFQDHKAVVNGPPLDFVMQQFVSHYPVRLEITKRRNITAYNPEQQYGREANPKFKINDDGTVVFTLYEKVETIVDNRTITSSAQRKTELTFLAMSAVERCGGQVNQGHFAAHTRDEKTGVINTHEDAKVTTDRSENVWGNSYLLSLKCIKRTPIAPSGEVPLPSTIQVSTPE